MRSIKILNKRNLIFRRISVALVALILPLGVMFAQTPVSFANTSVSSDAEKLPFHLDLDAPAEQMAKMLEARETSIATLNRRKPRTSGFLPSQSLQPIVEIGKRGLDWLKAVNAVRNPENRFSLSSKETTVGYPIDAPKESNVQMIKDHFGLWKVQAPQAIQDVVLSAQTSFPTDLASIGVSDSDFLKWGLQLNRIYQSATRWQLQAPYLRQYAGMKRADIRGFYFLGKEAGLESKLKGWKAVPDSERARLRSLLVGLCYNDSMIYSMSQCDQQMDVAQGKNQVFEFYQKYLSAGQKKWVSYFKLENARDDVEWTASHSDVMTVPFVRPESDAIRAFLQDNIEDEWKVLAGIGASVWNLRLGFVNDGGSDTAHVEFQAGSTPHVNGLGGSTITMDDNAPLTEYDVQWTIRHEFGHVLGLPDCYIEFYDDSRSVMVSYQIDITNLMCSRRGVFQEKHYEELKKNYFH